jgi:hypothetical protein
MSESIFEESPEPTDKHVINYLKLFGGALADFRLEYPTLGCRTQSRFLEVKIEPYFGKPVNRKTLAYAEKGNHKVNIGIYAAVLHEMGVWPDIINVLKSGTVNDVVYIELVVKELREKQKKEQVDRMKALSKKFFNEIIG